MRHAEDGPDAERSGHIVVGTDGSDGGRRALAWALEEAAALAVPVHAVTVWHWDGLEQAPLAAGTPDEAREGAGERQREDVRAAIGERAAAGRGAATLITDLVEGSPGPALVRAAAKARMLVLGSHGHGLIHQAIVGSVSHYCIRHAECPVVVVPTPHPHRGRARPAAAGMTS